MRDAGRLDDVGLMKGDRSKCGVVEESNTLTKKHRYEVDHELVDETGREELLGDARATGDRDVEPVRLSCRDPQRRFEPVGDEGKRGATFALQGLASMMREHD